jgi:hypothetical protein
MDSSARREQILLQAASLDPNVYRRNKLISDGSYQTACDGQWDPTNLEIEQDELPIFDPVLRAGIERDDLVVLSDGNCYSKSSIANLVDQGVVTAATGRAKLPLTNLEMNDLDYALVDRDFWSSQQAGQNRTNEVIIDTYSAHRDESQEVRELIARAQRRGETLSIEEAQRQLAASHALFDEEEEINRQEELIAQRRNRVRRLREQVFPVWKRDPQSTPLSLYFLNLIGRPEHFTRDLWAAAIRQYWNDTQGRYDDEISGPELWSEVAANWNDEQQLQQYPFYIAEVLNAGGDPVRKYRLLAGDYAWELNALAADPDRLESSLVRAGLDRWPSVAVERTHTGLYEAFVTAIVTMVHDDLSAIRPQTDEYRQQLNSFAEMLYSTARARAPSQQQWEAAAPQLQTLANSRW